MDHRDQMRKRITGTPTQARRRQPRVGSTLAVLSIDNSSMGGDDRRCDPQKTVDARVSRRLSLKTVFVIETAQDCRCRNSAAC
jgi:hypothetical protein